MAFDSSRKSGRDCLTKSKSSPLSLLAARVLAKEEEEARHSLPIEKVELLAFAQFLYALSSSCTG